MIPRAAEKHIQDYIQGDSHKIFFLWGPRRSGKTTLLKQLASEFRYPFYNFDILADFQKFVPDRKPLGQIASSAPVILIDEVQNYPESTKSLKILFDEFKVKIIATGSSELRKKSQDFDSLSGRFTEHFCLPLSFEEIESFAAPKPYEEAQFHASLLEEIPIFGSYPEVYNHKGNEEEKFEILQNIFETYILKDIVNIYELRNIKLAKDILTKIALQIGHEVSLNELARSLGATVPTVSNYIEIFIKNFILIPLPSFKTNLRNAVSQHRKLYFMDLGIRNALVRDFRPLRLRPDSGGVFENFIISEIWKKILNEKFRYTPFFYREYAGKEVDLVLEDYYKKYRCFEIKQQDGSLEKVFPLPHDLTLIHEGNYADVIHSIWKQ